MLFLFSRISTWLFIEMIASLCLVLLNLVIPILMMFTSYRNMINFYLSSTALSSSLINCLYLFYLIQTFRSKVLSEINCRAIYYLHTSCVVILAYTIVAIHANFILCLFPSSSSDQNHSTRTCLKTCGICLRKFLRRFSFCFVLCVWSFSFTTTIPLLYSIDSNEKLPKPVYCPGTTQINYLEEWFDRNRVIQTILFNLIPLLISLLLSLIGLLKLLYDCSTYLYLRLKMSNCSSCLKKSSSYQQRQQTKYNSMPLLSSLHVIDGNNIQSGINLVQIIETTTTTTPTNEVIVSSNLAIQSCGHWLSKSFLRFLLVLSSCLLACIYPIVMRFYLIYFSVLVPLIFTVLNYSLGHFTLTPQQQQQQQQTIVENHTISGTIPSPTISSTDTQNFVNMNISKEFQKRTSIKRGIDNTSNEQFELQSPVIKNLLNERDESFLTISNSSTTLSTDHRSIIGDKQKYFSNRLYENTRNMFLKENN